MNDHAPPHASPLARDGGESDTATLPRFSRRGLFAVPLLAGLYWPALGPEAPRREPPTGAPRPAVASGLGSRAPLAGAAAQTELPAPVAARLVAAMREAIVEARRGSYPFGAVLVDTTTGQTVYRAHNTTASGDPTAHGELNALRGAGLAGLDLKRTVLVTTAEPCPMCAAAAVWAQVAGIAFGTSQADLSRLGLDGMDPPAREVVSHSPFGVILVVGGVLSQETDALYALE